MNVLSIGGSDPSSGAGIQSDIKTFSALGAYGVTVITTITSQNTKKFSKVEPVSPMMIKNQLDLIFSDFSIDAIKISMVYNSAIIKEIYKKLVKTKVPIIVDPVIKSTTGGDLLLKNALSDYKKLLLPLAFVITPNVYEAKILTGVNIRSRKDLENCALKLKKNGVKNIVITGVEFKKNKIEDFVLDYSPHFISGRKLNIKNHGSGCNFSAALAVQIAQKKNILDSVKFAKRFTFDTIKNSKQIGVGIPITQLKTDPIKKQLEGAILNFQKIKNIYKSIPECQTNFVFSENKPRSLKNILGVCGRIVKTGKSVNIAGDLQYGASKHVASAVLEVNRKFPQVLSGINIKFDPIVLQKFKEKNYVITSYDRKQEPLPVKKKENSSVSWGIKKSIKDLKYAPDVIFHRGDFGKEAMILVFGKAPSDVIKKISGIF